MIQRFNGARLLDTLPFDIWEAIASHLSVHGIVAFGHVTKSNYSHPPAHVQPAILLDMSTTIDNYGAAFHMEPRSA